MVLTRERPHKMSPLHSDRHSLVQRESGENHKVWIFVGDVGVDNVLKVGIDDHILFWPARRLLSAVDAEQPPL